MRKLILIATTAIFATWLALNYAWISTIQEGKIRLILGLAFALAILLRGKRYPGQPETPAKKLPPWAAAATACLGALAVVSGLVFEVHQFEWLGLLILIYSALRWALPASYRRDILLSLFLVYWVHPLPGQLFARFQFAMQALSVQGSEWLLHCRNMPVWADGMILRTGMRAFDVPQACSGMRTAVTVMLCTLGTAMFLRLRLRQTLAFLVLGLAQVLFFNILRISFMVLWAWRKPPEWSEEFLHNTSGFFLLLTILVVQIELAWWKARVSRREELKRQEERGEREPREKATILPPVWRLILRWFWPVTAAVLIITAAVYAFYKHRPAHRLRMIGKTADGLLESNPAAAERAAEYALSIRPDSRDFMSRKARAAALQGKFEQALSGFDSLPNGLNLQETVLKSLCLMKTDRPEEAMALVDGLPESRRGIPAVAALRAEYAYTRDMPGMAAENAVIAGRSHLMAERVRRLFPYLASRGQWQAIVSADNRAAPYRDLAPALIAVHAHIQVNDIPGASKAMNRALSVWPSSPRFLQSLYGLALREPAGGWEKRFARILTENLNRLDPARAASCLKWSFRLARPDLAWLAFRRLEKLDPRDPMLFEAPARYGAVWFTFTRRNLGLPADGGNVTVDLRSFYRETADIEPFRSFWAEVPLAGEMGARSWKQSARAYLKKALEELAGRREAGTLSARMAASMPSLLAMNGKYRAAHAELDRLAGEYPEMKVKIILEHARFHEMQGEWQKCYERLREYRAAGEAPDLNTELMFANVLMQTELGICALEVIKRAEKYFPDVPQLAVSEAGVWDAFGFAHRALFLLEQVENPDVIPGKVRLLRESGRIRQARRLAGAFGLETDSKEITEGAELVLPAAELTVSGTWPEMPSGRELRLRVRESKRRAAGSASPFLKTLWSLEAEWYESAGGEDASMPKEWRSAGRDSLERAAALHRLAVLLGRRGDLAEAESVTREALRLLPGSPILYRMLISLTEGDPGVVEAAREACPDDPAIWLALLVTKIQNGANAEWAMSAIESAAAERKFPAATMVRAGSFLFREGMTGAAAAAAKDAIQRADGLPAAYALGVQCAAEMGDEKRLLECSLKGADFAMNPTAFYRVIVAVKGGGRTADRDVIEALRHLREQFPEEKQWSESLARTYFQRGDSARAWDLLDPLVRKDFEGVRVGSLLVAAESARLAGARKKALRILETAYDMYPENISVLNNLVYLLSGDMEEGLDRAIELLPELKKLGGNLPEVMDTAAVVYLKSGRHSEAAEASARALKMMDRRRYGAPQIRLNAATIMVRTGQYAAAEEQVREVLKHPHLPAEDARKARELFKVIQEKRRMED
ncbi:MAG: archaeosortase/exosortase family protein [Kiritimatiellia bacterium]